jgi:hypothetical protein
MSSGDLMPDKPLPLLYLMREQGSTSSRQTDCSALACGTRMIGGLRKRQFGVKARTVCGMPSSVPFNAADEGLASDGRAVPATSMMRSRTCRPLPREQPKTESWLSASGQAAGDKRVPLPVIGCVFLYQGAPTGGYLIGYCGGNCGGYLLLGSTFCYLAIAVRFAEVGINSGGKQHTVITRNPSFEILSLVRLPIPPLSHL